MKILVSILFLFQVTIGVSQAPIVSRVISWRNEIPKNDTLSEVEKIQISSEEIDYFSNGTEIYDEIITTCILKNNGNRKYSIQRSLILDKLSTMTVTRMSSIGNAKSKRISSLRRLIQRVILSSKTNFNYVSVHSFTIPALKSEINFHLDRSNDESPFHLYKGKKPSTKERESPDFKQIPLEKYTSTEIFDFVKKKFRTKHILKVLKNGSVSYYGCKVYLNEQSLNSRKIPQLKVVIILGFRNLHRVKN